MQTTLKLRLERRLNKFPDFDVILKIVIDQGVLPSLLDLLEKKNLNKNITQRTCWEISNVAACTDQQIQCVIQCGLIPHLIQILKSKKEFEVRKEAAYTIINIVTNGNQNQVK